MRGESDVDVLAVHLAFGIAHADRVGAGEGVDGIRAVAGDLVDAHHPGRAGVEQPDAGPDRPARIAVDHGQRQPAPPGIGGGGHVEPLEQAEVADPVGPAIPGPVVVDMGA